MKKDINLKQIKELEEKVADLTAGWQRTQADFVNYKRQSAEENAKLCRRANADLIFGILPVLDNFQLAAKHIPENLKEDNWAVGINQIEKQLESVLLTEGLEKISSVGQEFNPEFHEATEQIESDKPEGEVMEELQAGYKFNGDVLRPAKVKVSKGENNQS